MFADDCGRNSSVVANGFDSRDGYRTVGGWRTVSTAGTAIVLWQELECCGERNRQPRRLSYGGWQNVASRCHFVQDRANTFLLCRKLLDVAYFRRRRGFAGNCFSPSGTRFALRTRDRRSSDNSFTIATCDGLPDCTESNIHSPPQRCNAYLRWRH